MPVHPLSTGPPGQLCACMQLPVDMHVFPARWLGSSGDAGLCECPSDPVHRCMATMSDVSAQVTYCRIHQLRSRVFSQSHARSLLTGGHISSTHPALQAIVGDMPLSQWMSSFLSADGATLAQQPFENCRELLARWRMHERQLEEQLEALQAAMRSTGASLA